MRCPLPAPRPPPRHLSTPRAACERVRVCLPVLPTPVIETASARVTARQAVLFLRGSTCVSLSGCACFACFALARACKILRGCGGGAFWQAAKLGELTAKEEAFLESKSKHLREYLLREVVPSLAAGLMEVRAARPSDYVDHLVRAGGGVHTLTHACVGRLAAGHQRA